ncbi:MAG TPA: hypothetical protein VEA69_17325 [Tepidisphaeraceae bacterium]|nr:hypothetical protein [Tepidisphaeraceae bacterium]
MSRYDVEGFEDRRLLSAAAWAYGAPSIFDESPAIEMPVRSGVAAPSVGAVKAAKYADVTGTWKATIKIATSKTPVAGTMTITSQKGAAAIGTFALGPIVAGAKHTGTAIVGTNRSFSAVLQGKGYYGSITATISANGQQITGRWSCNVNGKWQTGTVVMEKLVAKR